MSETNELAQPEETPKKRPIFPIILGVIVIVGIIYGIRTWSFNSNHVASDDAFVTNSVIPVSPRVAGNVSKLLVGDNDKVKAGQLLVQLDDATFRQSVAQAQADLAQARAAAQGSSLSVGLTAHDTGANFELAQGAIVQGTSDIATAQVGVERALTGVQGAQADASTARAQEIATEKGIATAKSALTRSLQQVKVSNSLIVSAEASVRAAKANAVSAEAEAANAAREAARAATLSEQGAISRSVADARSTTAASARAQADSAKQQVAVAEASLAQRRADAVSANAAVQEARNAVVQASAQATAAKQSVLAQVAKVAQSKADVAVARQAVDAAIARQAQTTAKLHLAQSGPQQVSISTASAQTAAARVLTAMAALRKAEIDLGRTRIYAPEAGTVSSKAVEIGQQVSVGQPLLSIVKASTPWVIANLKETDLTRVMAGQKVEIDVDALPGVSFTGRVGSISQGTGATFALLPPDNATGNFTKVVQRVPVKILLDGGQPKLDRLRAGLSVSAVITTQ